ncbi:MAG: hypothetical protein AAF352_08850 [Pseudomonadota bacterium]
MKKLSAILDILESHVFARPTVAVATIVVIAWALSGLVHIS